MRLRSTLAATTALCGALMACTVGPDFSRPDAPKAMSFCPTRRPNSWPATFPAAKPSRWCRAGHSGQWWRVPVAAVNADRNRAACQSDIRAAAAGLKQARENARPSVPRCFRPCRPDWRVAEHDAEQPVAGDRHGALIYGLFTVGLTLTYNLDLWGGIAGNRVAGCAGRGAMLPARGAYLSLASNVVAAASWRPRSRPGRSDAAHHRRQRETLGILQRQSGWARSRGDVAVQQAALAQAEATLPPLQKALAQQRNLLATLTPLSRPEARRAVHARRSQAAAGTADQPAVQAGRANGPKCAPRAICILPASVGRRDASAANIT